MNALATYLFSHFYLVQLLALCIPLTVLVRWLLSAEDDTAAPPAAAPGDDTA